MDVAGVAAALLVTSAVYGSDNSYALEAVSRHPDRFRAIGRADPEAADLDEVLGAWRAKGLVGLRLIIGSEAERSKFRARGFHRLLRTCAASRLPVCVFPPGILAELGPLAESLPEVSIVIDHLGLAQPPLMDPESDPFGRLPDLIALAGLPNIFVKMTAVPVLANEPYPFADLWPRLHSVLDAFGPERVMWGSDATRTAALHTFEQAVDYVRESSELSSAEKAQVLGGTLRRVFDWPRSG
jgi:predicted TIM-barrel fold metal-dependent hydrolase